MLRKCCTYLVSCGPPVGPALSVSLWSTISAIRQEDCRAVSCVWFTGAGQVAPQNCLQNKEAHVRRVCIETRRYVNLD